MDASEKGSIELKQLLDGIEEVDVLLDLLEDLYGLMDTGYDVARKIEDLMFYLPELWK